MKIEIDNEVFEFLKSKAEAFVDTPNSVLRRLLLGVRAVEKDDPSSQLHDLGERKVDTEGTEEFIQTILSTEFENALRRRKPYRMMYEGDGRTVYFQNYNKESDKLWYRITAKPWKELQSGGENSLLCLTNPTERVAYMIPMPSIVAQVERSGWDRDYLEINIDHIRSRWIELDWPIRDYLKKW